MSLKDKAKATAKNVEGKVQEAEVGSQPCRSVSQGVAQADCLPKTAWPPTSVLKFN